EIASQPELVPCPQLLKNRPHQPFPNFLPPTPLLPTSPMAPIAPLTKTTTADRARCQANRAGSTPADAPSDGVATPNNTIAAPANTVAPAVPPSNPPEAVPTPVASDDTVVPAPTTVDTPVAPVPTTPNVNVNATPVIPVAPVIFAAPPTPKNATSAAPAPIVATTPSDSAAQLGTILASAAPDVLAIGETRMSVIDVDPSPCPDTTRRDDFPPLPSPGNETMTPVSHAEKRKGKGKGKAKETGVFTTHAPQNQLNMLSSQSPGVRSRRRPGGPHAYKLPHPPRPRHDEDQANLAAESPCRSRTPLSLPPLRPLPPSPPRPRAPANEPEACRRRADDEGRAIPTPDPARPYYGTVDDLPPCGSYMPTPAHGHRTIMGMSSPFYSATTPPAQRLQWDGAPHPKLLCWISSGNGNRLQMVPRLQTHIANRLNMNPADVRVRAPGLGEGPGPDPIAWLISVPEEQAQVLLDMGALNSDDGLLTFYVPYTPPITPFLCTLAGLTIPEADTELALAIIGDAIAGDNDIARFVRATATPSLPMSLPTKLTCASPNRSTSSPFPYAPRAAPSSLGMSTRAPPPTTRTPSPSCKPSSADSSSPPSTAGKAASTTQCTATYAAPSTTLPTSARSPPSPATWALPPSHRSPRRGDREALNTSHPGKFQQGKNNNTKGNGKGKGKDREDRGGKGGNNRRK
ncbi:hypothetical protein B0H10DRAFT_2340238, partial [Mycena sp. CBHHK59/15]